MHHMQSAPHPSHSPQLFNQGAHAHAHVLTMRPRNPIASIHVKRQHGTMSSPGPEAMQAHPREKLQAANYTCPQRNER
ncbi:hypothetical protein COCVIDRAFT_39201 [Bipolaris victoriae FI3]|uniref:Uncharacterized protein n=1 Tax=Bipolaris victoriae (strain FI3) TaxID=930091 RepID=W7EM41_BIPV3|nr:hypothetical protein COCVIDRAFT_39201 [Bipolaris victoriae FI3]